MLQDDEIDDDEEEPDDGEWAGIPYYECKKGRGMFVLLNTLKPGRRMTTVVGGSYVDIGQLHIAYKSHT